MKTDLDDLPSYESKKLVRKKYNWNNDVSRSHVERWLHSKVDESFETVFSEWTKLSWLPSRLRNLDYFKHFVQTEFAVGENGELFSHSYGYVRPLNNEFYVHPDSHKLLLAEKLKRVSYKKQQQEKMNKIFRSLGDYEQLCKIDGIWYHVILNSSYEVSFYDSISKSYKTKTVQLKKGKTYFDICGNYWSSDATKIVKQKEQLDSKALKHYNLKND
jgi:hypothetical protein